MGHFTPAVCDGRHRMCGSRAQEDTPSAPTLQTRSSLTTNATQACSSHTAVCFLVHLWFYGFIWLINTRVSTNLPLCWFPWWCNQQSWPDLAKWPLPSFLLILLLGLDYIQLLISKGLNLTAAAGGNVSCSPQVTSCHRKRAKLNLKWFSWREYNPLPFMSYFITFMCKYILVNLISEAKMEPGEVAQR